MPGPAEYNIITKGDQTTKPITMPKVIYYIKVYWLGSEIFLL